MIKLYDPKSDHVRFEHIEPRKSSGKEDYRLPERRDYARLIHSAAFRRLQGKTQLFPSHENDFFRNRLTHSFEVAQIAKSIAAKINYTNSYFKKNPINESIVEIAGLAHDLGHPPFGHNGEEALDECMRNFGGFEGNAQTFRILSKLEKRQTSNKDDNGPIAYKSGVDYRCGLNLTARVLASTLKYDSEIPLLNRERGKYKNRVFKGYYKSDREIVDFVKETVTRQLEYDGSFKTIECTIMDVADDIAYSTYDLEDTFKAGFIDPLSMLASSEDLLRSVAEKVNDGLYENYTAKAIKSFLQEEKFSQKHVEAILATTFANMFTDEANHLTNKKLSDVMKIAHLSKDVAKASKKLVDDGYYRTDFTSGIVGEFIKGVEVKVNPKAPMLSKAFLNIRTFAKVEVFKRYTFEAQILSSRLLVAQHRGKQIVETIFKEINSRGDELLPDDFRCLYRAAAGYEKQRVICDFVAGMTDRYALEFYNRLCGTNLISIHKPF